VDSLIRFERRAGAATSPTVKCDVKSIKAQLGLYVKCRRAVSFLLMRPTFAQLLKDVHKFRETRRFVTVFTRTRHWSLS